MDFYCLRAFVTVANEGNLTRAAERLFLSQPALSLQIKKLQNQLDVELFHRTSRGMRLTEAGLRLLPFAQRTIEAADELKASAAGLRNAVSGCLRLGTILDPEFLRLGRFLGVMTKCHPVLSFELTHGMSGTVARLVEDDQLDVAFTLDAPINSELENRFHVVPLTIFRYRVVAPPGWSGRVQGKDWCELAELPWIGTPSDSVHNRLLSKIFLEQSVSQNIVAQVDLEPSMMDLVCSGVGLALARDNLAIEASHSRGIVIADRVSLDAELCFICKRAREKVPSMAAAIEAVKAVWYT